MLRAAFLTFIAVLLIFTFRAKGQGNVTVHAPAGLDALVKKKHPPEKKMPEKGGTPKPGRSKPGYAKPAPAIDPGSTDVPGKPFPMPKVPPADTKKSPFTEYPVHLVSNTRRRGSGTIYSGKGFRVQIYYGPDREKAIKIKTEFMRLYPDVRTYLTYISPTFRVKVGDYRNRNDAAGMLKEANSMYSPCMIVPDIITINTF
jgi:hypothetical protein